MRLHIIVMFLTVAVLVVAPGSMAQDPNAPRSPGDVPGDRWFGRQEEPPPPENTRSLEGTVLDPSDELVEGAVVQLKDTKTLRVRSYVTLEDGTFRFHGLSTETDYEVKATHEGLSSRTRRLTVYDSRRRANMNLKLEPEG